MEGTARVTGDDALAVRSGTRALDTAIVDFQGALEAWLTPAARQEAAPSASYRNRQIRVAVAAGMLDEASNNAVAVASARGKRTDTWPDLSAQVVRAHGLLAKRLERFRSLMASLESPALDGEVVSETTNQGAQTILAAKSLVAALVDIIKAADETKAPVVSERDENVLAALRARMSGGVILSNGRPKRTTDSSGNSRFESDQFAQAASYLALEMQPRLWQGGRTRCTRGDTDCAIANEKLEAGGYNEWYFEPIVAVRLTTVPVASALTAANPQISAPGTDFLQSQKAAQVQLGAVLTRNFGGFAVGSSKFHWSLGLSGRYGLTTVTDSQRALRPWDFDNDLFKQPAGGVRLALYEQDQALGGGVRKGWGPTAYLDISLGKFENFESATSPTGDPSDEAAICLRDPLTCITRPEGPPASESFRLWNRTRVAIEARVYMKILYLGVDVNTGKDTDDMRYVGGVTFKLDKFFKTN